MKKLCFALMAVVAMNFVSCTPPVENPPEPNPKADTTFVAEEILYRVSCSPAIFKIADVKLEYIAFPDSNDIKTVNITDNWNSDVYSAISGTFGMRITFTPKEELNITDDLFDEEKGAYLYLDYGTRDVFKEGYATEFYYSNFVRFDLRGKIKYKDGLNKEEISHASDAVAYSFEYDSETNRISIPEIKGFWDKR